MGKGRKNITIGSKLEADAVEYASKELDMEFSEFIRTLVREELAAAAQLKALKKFKPGLLAIQQARTQLAP